MSVAAPAPGVVASGHRLDVFRRGYEFLSVVRASGRGSLKTLFLGDLRDDQDEDLGRRVLEWMAAASELEAPTETVRFPEDLLPDGWRAGHWYDFMRAAELCAIERLPDDRLCLRPYKNLEPVGEEFSHEGSHALDCAGEPRALGAGLRAALDISSSISRVTRSQYLVSGPHQLSPIILRHLERLGARLYQRPAHSEVVEVADGFFLLPPALRQLIFDVVWRNLSRVKDPAGTEWQVRWFPLTTLTIRRAWPLMCLAAVDDADVVLRLDSATPADPTVYQLAADQNAADVIGPAGGEGAAGAPLSQWLAELQPV